MTLLDAKEGEWLVVTGLASDQIAIEALRFGIDEGAQIRLSKKLPGGPVIVSKNQLEIAIGRQLAVAIQVARTSQEKA